MTELMDWNKLTQDWRAVEVDTSACMSVVNSVRRRTLMLLSGVILEILGLIAIVAILVYLQRLLPLSKPLIVWALFGLGVSITSVVFKIRNSIGLWRSEAESTSDMLKLSEQRLQAIARTNRFSRRLTLVFAIVLPVWIAVVLFVQAEVLLANIWITLSVLSFATIWIGIFWFSTGKSLRRCELQLEAVQQLLSEFSDS